MSNCELAPYGSQIICKVQKKDNSGYQNGLYVPDLMKDQNATFHEVVEIGPKVEAGLVKEGDLVVLTDKETVSLRYKGDIYVVADSKNIMLVMEKD